MYLPDTVANTSGSSCVFYTVGNKGLKLWYSYSQAKEQWINQSLASERGIGPKVLSEVEKVNGYSLWGFYTELAILYTGYSNVELWRLNAKFKRVFGYRYPDGHDDNIGRINGKLVFIDFEAL